MLPRKVSRWNRCLISYSTNGSLAHSQPPALDTSHTSLAAEFTPRHSLTSSRTPPIVTPGSGRVRQRSCNLRRTCSTCLLYTSDAADDLLCVDLGGRRIIKKK